MLTRLHIRNFALIEEVELEFGGGFNVLTGETGAGKSILIDAINAVLGGRAGPEWLRTGTDRASIEAVFELPQIVEGSGLRVEGSAVSGGPSTLNPEPSTSLADWIEDGQLILSRELTRAGKSQCRLNGRICTAGTLREVAGELIDIHGQHEHQSLLQSERHVDLLDAWAGSPVLELRRRAETEYAAWSHVRRELASIRSDERDRARQLDLYQFQIDEIDEAKPIPGEEEELTTDRLRLANAEKLSAAAAGALEALGEGNVSALDLLATAAREVEAAAALDTGLAAAAESLQTALIAAQDAASELRAYQEGIEFNPDRLEQVQDRLDLLRTLKKKYGDTLEEVLEYRQRIGEELHALTHHEERLAELEAELGRRAASMDVLAAELYAARQAAAAEFERRLVAELRDLNMQHTVFEVSIEPPAAEATGGRGDGATERRGDGESDTVQGRPAPDAVFAGSPRPPVPPSPRRSAPSAWFGRVEFLISPNPGEPVRPLARIASGGELSRIMLALKSVMAGCPPGTRAKRGCGRISAIPTLIFDEIDVGVGGRTAQVLGEKMAGLSQTAQVLCVTHLPQIAGMAAHHFQVEKQVVGERTLVQARALTPAHRVDELARMLGGKEETAARHARELLAGGGRNYGEPLAVEALAVEASDQREGVGRGSRSPASPPSRGGRGGSRRRA